MNPALPLASWVILETLVTPYPVSAAQISLIPQICGFYLKISQKAHIGHDQNVIVFFHPFHKPTVVATLQ